MMWGRNLPEPRQRFRGPKERRHSCPRATAVPALSRRWLGVPAQKRLALLLAAFLFPGGGAIYAAPWILGLRIAERIKRVPHGQAAAVFRMPVGVFVGWVLISALFSPLPAVALESWALAAIAFGIILPAMTDALDGAPELVRNVHRACAAGTLGAAVYGLLFLRAQHLARAQLPGLGPNALG